MCEVTAMSERKPLRRYALRGGIDVNMYNTLLEPGFALGMDAENFTVEEESALWARFDIDAYRRRVLELATPMLKQIIEHSFSCMRASLVPGSATICSPQDYSYGGDELRFEMEAQSDVTDAEMQAQLDSAVHFDWNAEFGSHYRICEKLIENYTICLHIWLAMRATIISATRS